MPELKRVSGRKKAAQTPTPRHNGTRAPLRKPAAPSLAVVEQSFATRFRDAASDFGWLLEEIPKLGLDTSFDDLVDAAASAGDEQYTWGDARSDLSAAVTTALEDSIDPNARITEKLVWKLVRNYERERMAAQDVAYRLGVVVGRMLAGGAR
jgi:hypothetical protein